MKEALICTAKANAGAANGSRRRRSSGSVHAAVATMTASPGPGPKLTQTPACWTTASTKTSASNGCRLSHCCDLMVAIPTEGCSCRSSRGRVGCASGGASHHRGSPPLERQAGTDAEAARGSRPHIQLTAVQRHALAHADEAVAARLSLLCPGSVVDDLQRQRVLLVAERHACACGTRVLERVGQRLLHDAIGGHLDA